MMIGVLSFGALGGYLFQKFKPPPPPEKGPYETKAKIVEQNSSKTIDERVADGNRLYPSKIPGDDDPL